jgi:hypothetical protein
MTWDVDLVVVAMMALTVLLLVAGTEALWRRRGRGAMADAPRPTSGTERVTAAGHHARRRPIGRPCSRAQGLGRAQPLPRNPEAGVARGIIKLVAVYRTDPVMVVGETADGALLERSLHELAERARAPAAAALAGARGAVSGVSHQVSPTRDGHSPRSARPRRPPKGMCFRLAWAPLSPGPIPILS